MSLPKPFKFAPPGTSYPAGGNSWNGQNVAVVPGYNFFTPGPGFQPTAEELNYLLQQMTVTDKAALDLAAQEAVSTWWPVQNPVVTNIQGITWSPNTARWLTLQQNTGTGKWSIYYTRDGRTFTEETSGWQTTGAAMGIQANTGQTYPPPQQEFIVVHNSSGSTVQIVTFPSNTATTQTALNGFLNNPALAYWNVAGLYYLATFNQSGATFTSKLLSSNGGGGVWTDVTTIQLPSNWQSGTNHPGKFFFVESDGTQVNAQGDPRLVLVMCGVTPGTDTARLLEFSTATDITPAFLASNSLVIMGMAFSTVDQLWGILALSATAGIGGTPALQLWTCPDIIASGVWTRVWTGNGVYGGATGDLAIPGLAVIGSTWVVASTWVDQGSKHMARVLYSSNVASGAPTWSVAGIPPLTPQTGGTGLNNLTANDHGLVYWTPLNIVLSQQAGTPPNAFQF